MKNLFLLVLFLGLVGCALPSERDYVIPLTSNFGSASGVKIAHHRVLTAAHVAKFGVFLINNKSIKILGIDEVNDLAVIEADVECPCVEIGKIPEVDDEVLIIGYPLSRVTNNIQISVSGKYQGMMKDKKLLFTGFGAPGVSGGGIFNRYGKLVSIASGIPITIDTGWPAMVFNMPVGTNTQAMSDIVQANLI